MIPLKAIDEHVDFIIKEREYIFHVDFKRSVNQYLSTRTGLKIQSVAELITFNQHTPGQLQNGNSAQQRSIETAEKTIFNDIEYQERLELYRKRTRESIDLLIDSYRLDAITGEMLTIFAAPAGYPGITVPTAIHENIPVGIYFVAKPWQEGNLLSIAYGYEQATKARRNPTFIQP